VRVPHASKALSPGKQPHLSRLSSPVECGRCESLDATTLPSISEIVWRKTMTQMEEGAR